MATIDKKKQLYILFYCKDMIERTGLKVGFDVKKIMIVGRKHTISRNVALRFKFCKKCRKVD